MDYHILAINPGSTSTKIGFFEGSTSLFSSNISHDAKTLSQFSSIADQFSYRKEQILEHI